MHETRQSAHQEVIADAAHDGMRTPAGGRLSARYRHLARAGGVGALLVGLLALLGWSTGQLRWAGILPDAKALAPGMAIIVGLLGAVLAFAVQRRLTPPGRLLARVLLAAIALFTLTELWCLFAGTGASPEWLLLKSHPLLATPNARSSPIALTLALLQALALYLGLLPPSRFAGGSRRWAGILASLILVIAATVLFSYGFRHPLLEHTAFIPAALPAALAFLLLSGGAIAALGPSVPPIALFSGSPTRRLLNKAFIPLIFSAVLLALAVHLLLTDWLRLNAAILTGAVIVALLLLTVTVSARVAAAVGGRLEHAEAALHQLQERLAVTLHSIGDAVITTDVQGRITMLNHVATALTGWSEEAAVGRPVEEVFRIVNERTRLAVENPVAKVLASGRIEGLANHTVLIARDGAEYAIADSGAPIHDADGKTLGVVLVFRDVTDERRAEHALSSSEKRYRRLFEHARDGILILDAERFAVLDVNPALLALFGVARDEVLGRPLAAVHDFFDDAMTARMYATLRRDGYCRQDDITLTTRDGHRIAVEFTGSVYRVNGDSVIQCLVRDISEQQQVEEQLRQAVKMESVGRLAGGIAHDFNNILTGISGFSQLVTDALPPASSLRGDMREVLALSQRAADLTRQLLTFSRQHDIAPHPVDLNALVHGTLKMLQRLIGEDISIRFDPGEDLGAVNVDPGRIEQVLMNLTINARDAMPDGGTLTLATRRVRLDVAMAEARFGVAPGDYLLLTVADTGYGMDAETQRHIFEPFFTTKEVGMGSGLGLATVYGIVTQHGGNILVESAPNHGAVFSIYLPCVESAVAAENAVAAELPFQGGQETILVVEDEEAVREVIERILTLGGYIVLCAANATVAEAMFHARQDEIALLVTDVVMPGGNGVELAQRLCAQAPALRIIYMSGYHDNPVLHEATRTADVVLLRKPFTMAQIFHAIHEALDDLPEKAGSHEH